MDRNQASKITETFIKYLEIGAQNKEIIAGYSRRELIAALDMISEEDSDKRWYQAIKARVAELRR